MLDQLAQFFSSQGFMPHGMCFAWTPALLWTMVSSDLVIVLSYYSIPAALFVAVRRRRSDSLNRILLMFAAFILACGTTHLIDIWTIWYPRYWIDAFAKVSTAGISAATAIALWPIVGRATSYVESKEASERELSLKNEELAETLAILEQQKSDLHFLNEFSRMLNVAQSEGEVSGVVANAVETLWPDTAGALYLQSRDADELTLAREWGEASHPLEIDRDTCWAQRLAKPFPGNDGAGGVECAAAGCGEMRACFPVIGGGETQGLLHLEGVDAIRDERSRALLPVLVERLGLSLQDLRLKQSLEYRSTRDALTGLFNRRYLEEALALEERRSERYGSDFAVVLFDLDHFKRLNDTHGHDAGDAGLRLFAEVLESTARASDVPGRYGGEEFLIILPDTDLDEAKGIAERVRATLESTCGQHLDPRFHGLTVSAGVARYPDHGSSPSAVIASADEAMYTAKEAGRNAVRVA